MNDRRERRIFVWEYLSAVSGLPGCDAPAQLAREGNAMLRALVADFAGVPGLDFVTLHSAAVEGLALPAKQVCTVASLAEEQRQFDRLAADAQWTIVVAPEIAGVLLNRCRRVVSLGGRLLGPAPEFVALTSDKHLTAEHLRSAGVAAPQGIALSRGDRLPECFRYPAVLKPRDGAGSQNVRLIAGGPSGAAGEIVELTAASRLEQFCPGMAVSVAALCGPGGCFTLPACHQHLSGDGRFDYLGGSLPLAKSEFGRRQSGSLSERAERMARRAIAALPPALGYVGLDIVLGPAQVGTQDFVIEVNPRLTTSYVGLRAAAEGNLAQAMLDIAEERTPTISFRAESVEFMADGTVRIT